MILRAEDMIHVSNAICIVAKTALLRSLLIDGDFHAPSLPYLQQAFQIKTFDICLVMLCRIGLSGSIILWMTRPLEILCEAITHCFFGSEPDACAPGID